MIIGIGNDIIETERVVRACSNEKFIKRNYTEREISAAAERLSFFADNFAVKESVSKCLGTGFRGFGLKDIEVLRDELGKPYVNLYGGAANIADSIGVSNIHISISNLNNLVAAFAVAESR